MVKKYDLLELAFNNGATIKQENKTYFMKVESVGIMKVTSGKIIACDPSNFLAHIQNHQYQTTFPIGSFPVEIVSQNGTECLVRVVFSDEPAVRWEKAIPEGADVSDLKEEDVFCVGVDLAAICFMDKDAFDTCVRGDQFSLDCDFGDQFSRNAILELRNSESNVVFIDTGADFCYPFYIGYDKEGNVCRFVLDLCMFSWGHPDSIIILDPEWEEMMKIAKKKVTEIIGKDRKFVNLKLNSDLDKIILTIKSNLAMEKKEDIKELLSSIDAKLDITEDERLAWILPLKDVNLQKEKLDRYWGFKLYKSEISVLQKLQELTGKRISKSDIKVHDFHVIKIDLMNKKLSNLPEYFSDLTHLEELSLRYNELDGLYKNFGSLLHLRKLNLEHNNFTMVPECIKSLTNLIDLNLSYNDITIIPNWIDNLKKLTTLSLTHLQVKEYPESLGNLLELKRLFLNSNKKVSFLPESLSQLTKLVNISLSDLPLTKLPEKFGNMSHITKLKLDNTEISHLPENIGNMTGLIELSIRNSKITALPESFDQLPLLKEMDLKNNLITSLPESFGHLSSLESLDLSNNQITSLPKSFRNLQNLKNLILNNNLIEKLPANIGDLTSLKTIDLDNNKLSYLPKSIGNLTNIWKFNLNSNQLIELPDSFTNLTRINYLYLNDNPQLLTLPDGMEQLGLRDFEMSCNHQLVVKIKTKKVQILETKYQQKVKNDLTNVSFHDDQIEDHLDDFHGYQIYSREKAVLKLLEKALGYSVMSDEAKNRVSSYGDEQKAIKIKNHHVTELHLPYSLLTELPATIDHLSNLKKLYLNYSNSSSMNETRLEHLPNTIGNLTHLQELNLFGNELYSIPESIGYLKELRMLDVSWNNLVILPESFSNLSNLINLKIDGNKLVSLPEGIGNLVDLKVFEGGNNRLVTLPNSIGKLKSLEILNLNDNRIITIPNSVGELQNLRKLNLSDNKLITLPTTIAKLPMLKSFDFYDNPIKYLHKNVTTLKQRTSIIVSGRRPKNLWDVGWNILNIEIHPQLQSLDFPIDVLEQIQLSPETRIKNDQVIALDLSNTNLTQIPDLSIFTNLKHLDLSYNNISEFPVHFWQLITLETIQIAGNQLAEIPNSIKQLINLKTLNISKNSLISCPNEISELKNLQILNISCNKLRILPNSLVKLVNLKHLDISNNQITEFPSFIKVFENLEFLNLCNNKINIEKGRYERCVVLFRGSFTYNPIKPLYEKMFLFFKKTINLPLTIDAFYHLVDFIKKQIIVFEQKILEANTEGRELTVEDINSIIQMESPNLLLELTKKESEPVFEIKDFSDFLPTSQNFSLQFVNQFLLYIETLLRNIAIRSRVIAIESSRRDQNVVYYTHIRQAINECFNLDEKYEYNIRW